MSLTKNVLLSLKLIREAELETITDRFADKNKNLLEIGSGTGEQLKQLSNFYCTVKGIEIGASNYSLHRVFPIIEYNGIDIPFENNTFEIIYSSNVLEHVPHIRELSEEMKRVLVNDGICIHLMPTHYWRFWSVLLNYIALPKTILLFLERRKNQKGNSPSTTKSRPSLLLNLFFPGRHGERGNRFNEHIYFKPSWWKTFFVDNGWEILECKPTGIFYSGHHLLGKNISISTRKTLSKFLGSSCYTYVIKK